MILQGARQIGKTTSIRDFGEAHYQYVAEINFDKNEEARQLFASTKDVSRILQQLPLLAKVPCNPGETLIFFDEIQECPQALAALKYFEEDAPEYHVIAAGSLLGVAINHKGLSFPVGKVNMLNMHPVTFKEYLRAADPTLSQYADSIGKIEALPEIFCNQMREHYVRYQICGGLPYVTRAMLEGEGSDIIDARLDEMLLSYSTDFSKHVEPRDVIRIQEIWKSIPSQLSRENKKFIFRVVREGARAREYELALEWLVTAGMIYKIAVSEKPAIPLSFYEDTTSFKVYMLDVGLLRRLSRLPAEMLLSPNELFIEFKGALAENSVLSSLLANGYDKPNYWTLSGNKAEVDFLVGDGLKLLPIEVKADTRISGKSFAEFDCRYHPDLRIRFSMKNLDHTGNLLNIPLYLADWLRALLPQV